VFNILWVHLVTWRLIDSSEMVPYTKRLKKTKIRINRKVLVVKKIQKWWNSDLPTIPLRSLCHK
jgi:hypothetical protein